MRAATALGSARLSESEESIHYSDVRVREHASLSDARRMARKKPLPTTRYLILQETGDNTYSGLGPRFEGFDDFASADEAAKERRDRFPHQTFVVAECVARYSHVTRAVVTKLGEKPPKASKIHIVRFPRSATSG